MTKSINPGDIGRINPNFKVNDFRQMVNYQSGTNKGYVRFTRTSTGGLKLEKINNKIDVPLSWRSNVGAANNRLMRQKFVEAMSGDLRYVGETQRNHIRDMVLTPRNDEGEIQKDTALSRREIKEALEAFDRAFNTAGGRMGILHNFFKMAMEECGFNGSEEEFKRDYLKLDEHGLNDAALLQYCTTKEDAKKVPDNERMVKSEVEFRGLIE